MSKSDEQQMAKLIRKNAAKAAANAAPRARKHYDPTLKHTQDVDPEARAFFAEMKKREF